MRIAKVEKGRVSFQIRRILVSNIRLGHIGYGFPWAEVGVHEQAHGGRLPSGEEETR